jgi:hypothetical protein
LLSTNTERLADPSSSRRSAAEERRLERRLERRKVVRRRRRRALVVVVLIVLSPAIYSYVSTMLQPSSLPLGVRSVEWLRANGAAPIVDQIERWYYEWKAPAPGGPTLKALPTLPAAQHPPTVKRQSTLRAPIGYRPPRVHPPIVPALAGEGVWLPVGPRVHGAAPVLVTEFRPEPSYPRIVAYVAWLDHSRTDLALYPGRYEPPAGSPRGPMQVPYGERWRLLATFNSGFTYSDGHGGFAVDGRSYEPLERGFATLVGYRNGRVNVISWRGGTTPARNVAFARQNLPLIVDNGKPNPNLNDGPDWGATLGNAIQVWRSGVGIDRHGNLIYAAADYQTVSSLAQILIRAGAVRAMQLDINTEWPSFITYGGWGGKNPSKLVPNPLQSASRYLVPDDRDFFAVYRRVSSRSGLVPFR